MKKKTPRVIHQKNKVDIDKGPLIPNMEAIKRIEITTTNKLPEPNEDDLDI